MKTSVVSDLSHQSISPVFQIYEMVIDFLTWLVAWKTGRIMSVAVSTVALTVLAQSQFDQWIVLLSFPISIITTGSIMFVAFHFYNKCRRLEQRMRYMAEELRRVKIGPDPIGAPPSITGMQAPIGYLRMLNTRFNKDELKDIAYLFGVGSRMEGLNNPELARGLLAHITHHDLVSQFEEWVSNERADIDLAEYRGVYSVD